MNLEDFRARLSGGDLWIFGYGSLIWSPGFRYKEKHLGRAHGYQVRNDLEFWGAHEWSNAKPGSIYHALKQMAKQGLVLAPSIAAMDVGIVAGLVVLMALLASLQPAWKASRMDPVTALGHV